MGNQELLSQRFESIDEFIAELNSNLERGKGIRPHNTYTTLVKHPNTDSIVYGISYGFDVAPKIKQLFEFAVPFFRFDEKEGFLRIIYGTQKKTMGF